MKKKFVRLLLLFLFWRISLLLLGFLSSPVIPDNPLSVAHLPSGVHPRLDIWVKWDGVWFYEIIETGYVREGLTAFFPLYPLTVRLVSNALFFLPSLLVGLSLSSLFLFAALVVFYNLLRLDYNDKFSYRAVFYLLIFPSSLFYTLLYSESLFLLLSLSAFYFARKKIWFLSSLSGFLAALTRPVGIILFIPLFFEYLISRGKGWRSLFTLFLIPAGLLSYMFYLERVFGDPLLFFHVQKDWGRFSSAALSNLASSLNPIEVIFFSFFLVSSLFVYRRVRESYGLYIFLNLLPPLISGSFMSVNRHFAVLFPVYILLSRLGKERLFEQAIVIISLQFLAYSIILYVNGYWVG